VQLALWQRAHVRDAARRAQLPQRRTHLRGVRGVELRTNDAQAEPRLARVPRCDLARAEEHVLDRP